MIYNIEFVSDIQWSHSVMCVYMLCIIYIYINVHVYLWGFPGDSNGKESTHNAGDMGSIPGLGRSPEGGHGDSSILAWRVPIPHGQRSLVACSPWGCRVGPDWVTKHSTAHTFIFVYFSLFSIIDYWKYWTCFPSLYNKSLFLMYSNFYLWIA